MQSVGSVRGSGRSLLCLFLAAAAVLLSFSSSSGSSHRSLLPVAFAQDAVPDTAAVADAAEFEADERQATPAGDSDHRVHIQFCVSWGMKRNYLETKRFLESQFPELRGDKITGSSYPPPPVVELLSKILSAVQMAGLAFFVIGAPAVFRMFGIHTVPSWYESISKNSVQIAIVLYLVLPQFLAKYLVSGAFEIVLDDDIVVFSKLAARRFPTRTDLVNSLVEAGLKRATPE